MRGHKVVNFQLIHLLFSLIEQGGDWDRRNRLKVYEGVHFLTIRKFSEAAALFLEGLATFTSEEIFPYNTFIFYTALVSIVSIDRVKLKEKVTISLAYSKYRLTPSLN